MQRIHQGMNEQVTSARSDMHRDEPHASGFRDALERLREYTIAGHLQVRRKERSGNNFTERGSGKFAREKTDNPFAR